MAQRAFDSYPAAFSALRVSPQERAAEIEMRFAAAVHGRHLHDFLAQATEAWPAADSPLGWEQG